MKNEVKKGKQKMEKYINELENKIKFLDAVINFLNSELKLVEASNDFNIPLEIDFDIKYWDLFTKKLGRLLA